MLSVIFLIISVFLETILVTLSLNILLVTTLSLRFFIITEFVETIRTTLSVNLVLFSTLSIMPFANAEDEIFLITPVVGS